MLAVGRPYFTIFLKVELVNQVCDSWFQVTIPFQLILSIWFYVMKQYQFCANYALIAQLDPMEHGESILLISVKVAVIKWSFWKEWSFHHDLLGFLFKGSIPFSDCSHASWIITCTSLIAPFISELYTTLVHISVLHQENFNKCDFFLYQSNFFREKVSAEPEKRLEPNPALN